MSCEQKRATKRGKLVTENALGMFSVIVFNEDEFGLKFNLCTQVNSGCVFRMECTDMLCLRGGGSKIWVRGADPRGPISQTKKLTKW